MIKLKNIIKSILQKYNIELIRTSPKSFKYEFRRLALQRKKQISQEIGERYDFTVQNGIFKGIKLVDSGAWSDGDLATKILGLYEHQVLKEIELIKNQKFNKVVNIGASEGYYAIGLSKVFSPCKVYTYDIDESATSILAKLAIINHCDIASLSEFSFDNASQHISLQEDDLVLFVLDCEGCEGGVVHMEASLVQKSYFIIELHEMFSKGITDRIYNFLIKTHNIKLIPEAPLNPQGISEMQSYKPFERALALDEFRQAGMNWLIATPRPK